MTPEAGDWVAAHVLTRRVVDGAGGLGMLRSCACQLGECGECRIGRCAKCPHATHPEWSKRPQPEAYMVDRRGLVVADVWTGQGCRWRCACTGQNDPWSEPEMFGATEQPSLFAGVA